jgi:CheY-like chemotaxis protein
MSHEIRTPLNAILGYTQLMQRDASLPPEQRDAVSGITSSGKHLLGLINEILDLSKIEAGRMELNPVDFDLTALASGLAATFRPLCAQKRIGFRLEAGPGARVRGDEGKLRQVLINLVGNAVKFTSGGEVFLGIRPAADGRWLFEVVDTGFGIPEHERADIFKPFHQGSGAQHQGGTGLGLAIAQRQVQLLGGQLDLESERGVGSRFSFSIPLAPASGELATVHPRVGRLAAGRKVCTLVVDDNRENREVLGRMLASAGCEVCFAAHGTEALKQLRARKPAIVFLDVILAGANGLEIAREILNDASLGSPKIVAHTASALARYREDAREVGCVDFLAKPFQCEQLYECLERHLGVEFEYATVTGETEATPDALSAPVPLPDQLFARLMVAAELHSTTALKACLQDLRAGGPETTRLAEEIRQLMRSYDMDGVQRLLSRMAVPTAAESVKP